VPLHLVSNTSPGAPQNTNAAGALLEILSASLIIGKVFSYNGTAFTDNTDEARLEGGTAFALFPTGGTNNICYFGSPAERWDAASGTYKPGFRQLIFDLATPGAGGAYVWEYWNGTAWAPLTVTDGTNGFTQDGTVSWTPPADWAATTVNGHNTYWVRVRPTTAPTTNPTCYSVTTLGWLIAFLGTNKAAYKQAPSTNWPRYHFRVDHSAGGDGTVIGYETMTDVDNGANRFPAGTETCTIWASSNATARPWFVVADGRTVILGIGRDDAESRILLVYFGDYVPANNQYKNAVCIGSQRSGGPAGQTLWANNYLAGYFPGVLAVSQDGVLISPYCVLAFNQAATSDTNDSLGGYPLGPGWKSGFNAPNQADGRVWVAPIYLVSNEAGLPIVGYLRGIWQPLHSRGVIADKTVLPGAGGMSGRALRIHDPVWTSLSGPYYGHYAVEISDTWDT